MIKTLLFLLVLILSLISSSYKTYSFAVDTTSAEVVRLIWEKKAQQWDKFIGKDGKHDLNRKLQSDPILMASLGDIRKKTVLLLAIKK